MEFITIMMPLKLKRPCRIIMALRPAKTQVDRFIGGGVLAGPYLKQTAAEVSLYVSCFIDLKCFISSKG